MGSHSGPSSPNMSSTPLMTSNNGNSDRHNPDLNTPQGPKTKGALKGWGNLSSSMSSTPGPSPMTTPQSGQKTRPVNTSSTFATFQRAAKEKADRERTLREQQGINRRTMEMKEKERQKIEHEKRKKEEEDALEQARRAMLSQSSSQSSHSTPSSAQSSSSAPSSVTPAPASVA